jgi:hypothetical protein
VDIDSTGTMEIFAAGNSVYAWHADGTPVISANSDGLFFRPPSGNITQAANGRFYSTPAIGDLDLDTNYEIVVAAWDDTLYVLDEHGNIKWKRGGIVPKWSSPALGDIDGDDSLEVFIASDYDTLYAWRHNGKPVISANPTGAFVRLPDGARVNYATPSFANIDGNSKSMEVFYGTNKGNVYAWNKTATQLWSFATGANRPLSTIAIGDVDNSDSDSLEVVFAQGKIDENTIYNNAVYILKANNGVVERIWSGTPAIRGVLASPNAWIHPPSLADLDGNGDLEIVVAHRGSLA